MKNPSTIWERKTYWIVIGNKIGGTANGEREEISTRVLSRESRKSRGQGRVSGGRRIDFERETFRDKDRIYVRERERVTKREKKLKKCR